MSLKNYKRISIFHQEWEKSVMSEQRAQRVQRGNKAMGVGSWSARVLKKTLYEGASGICFMRVLDLSFP
jgi:hypothetical protein